MSWMIDWVTISVKFSMNVQADVQITLCSRTIHISRCPVCASGITAEVGLCPIRLGGKKITRKVTLLLSVVVGRISTNPDKKHAWRLYHNLTWHGAQQWGIHANECCLLSRHHWFDRSVGKCSGSFSYSFSRLFPCIMLATYAINPTATHGECIFRLIFIFLQWYSFGYPVALFQITCQLKCFLSPAM